MLISIIAALSKDYVIGQNNDMPWHLPADMRYFVRTTKGHPIIMGRKCFESIGSKPLPRRQNIIITRNPHFQAEGCIVVHSLEKALAVAKEYYPVTVPPSEEEREAEVFIIGGGEIYSQALEKADLLYLTYIDVKVPEGDVFFPAFDPTTWKVIQEEAHQKDEKNPYDYTFVVLERLT